MAKNKKSKILAMALCASVMAGIYASPVMAKEFPPDSNSSVTTGTTTSGGYKQYEVHVNIDDGVNGSQTIGTFYSNEMEAGFKTDYTMTASTFTLEAFGETWASLTVDGLTYTNRTTLNNVSLTADGLTFSNLRNPEDAAVLNAAAINSWNEKTQNINAKDTVAGKTYFDGKVIADKFGTDNDGFHVDENGELKSNKIIVHKGEFTVDRNGAVKAANGAFTVDKDGNVTSKRINGVDVKAVEGTVDGLTVDVDNLTADTSRLSANVNDLSADTKRLTGNVENLKTDTQNIRADIDNLKTDIGNNNADISGLKDKTQGIDHYVDDTTYYNGAISATGSVMAGGIGNEAIIGGNTKDGGYLSLKDANDEYQTLKAAKLGTINNVITDEGEVVSQGDVTSINGTNTYSLNTIGANTVGIRRTQSGDTNVTVIEENLKVYDDGTIVGANENFKVTADGTVISDKLNVGNGNFTVSDEGIGAFGSKFTVNTNGEISTTGINVAEGMFTASAGGVTMANNNLSVDLNGNIKAGTYNGVKIGMNEDGDIILGDGTVIDDNFNSDNVAGITRKPLDDSAPGSGNTTFIEQNTAISADGIVVTDPESGVSTKTKYNGFYVKDEYGNNVSSLTQDKINLAGENLAYKDSEGNINITADTYTAGDVAGENVRVKADGIYVKDGGTIVSSLKDDGLMLTDQESGESHTLNATDIADIKGIDRSGNDIDGYTTTIEGATSFTKDGMTTNGLSVKGTYGGFHVEDVTNSETGESNTMIYTTDQEGHRTLSIDPNTGNLVTPGSLNVAGGRFVVDKDTGNMAVNAADGKAVFQVNGNDGTVHVGKVGGAQTVITGNSITTETLNVENIKLGNSMTDKDGNTITIGAAGVIDIEKDGNTVFRADTDNFEAHYNNYDLTLDGTNGFALSNEKSKFTLNGNGFAFAGPVNLGAASDVKFGYTGNLGGYTGGNYNLSQLVDTVNDIYNRTDGIYKDADGNTVISNEKGTWNETNKKTEYTGEGSKITIGDNGTTFENGEGNGTTNINGGAIDADSSSIGNDVSGGSGSGSSGMAGDGTYTDGSEHSGHFVDEDSSYEFTNDANGFTGTVTDGKNTTTIENGVKGSNTTVKGDNVSASSGVGIGNDGAFISDSVTNGDISHTVNGGDITNTVTDGSITDTVTNGDMTVTEVKDENGSATTVKDANGSSTVSQDTKGQTVSTGTGTSVNTGNDFGVTDNETGKSIYMSDIGHVEDIDSEIQNSDGSKTTVVDAVNNEAEIRRNEIERVDGRINNLENRVGELEDRIDKVGAMAAAIANLRTMGYDPAAPTEVAVGIGQYRDETGAALGLFHYPNRDFMLSLSVSTSGDEVMGGIGATWKFGRKSPEKVAEIKKAQAEADARRAEEAKLAKAEEMKQAAKEAKIKAQQERHAKLAAERAAQAEAAK